jgi:multicomponent Na+:H+ antiporter subunit C
MHIFGFILILIGFYGLITKNNIIKMIISLNVMEVGLNLFIVSTGYREGALAPILTGENPSTVLDFVDPLPQALVLTSIVIGVGTTALGLAFARKIYQKHNTFNLMEVGVGQ